MILSCLRDVLPAHHSQNDENELDWCSFRSPNFRVISVFFVFVNYLQFVIDCQALLIFSSQVLLRLCCAYHDHWDPSVPDYCYLIPGLLQWKRSLFSWHQGLSLWLPLSLFLKCRKRSDLKGAFGSFHFRAQKYWACISFRIILKNLSLIIEVLHDQMQPTKVIIFYLNFTSSFC